MIQHRKARAAALIVGMMLSVASSWAQMPGTFGVDPKALLAAHHRLDSGDAALQPAYDALLHEADRLSKSSRLR